VAAECVRNEPIRTSPALELKAGPQGISGILESVQDYLDSWPKERVAQLQKMDGGWGPFDARQRPMKISGAGAVQRTRDAIHRHCIALLEVGMPLTRELVELDEFFCAAGKLIEGCGKAAPRQWRPESRTPPTPGRQDTFVNW
jgi:hypothetical protein